MDISRTILDLGLLQLFLYLRANILSEQLKFCLGLQTSALTAIPHSHSGLATINKRDGPHHKFVSLTKRQRESKSSICTVAMVPTVQLNTYYLHSSAIKGVV